MVSFYLGPVDLIFGPYCGGGYRCPSFEWLEVRFHLGLEFWILGPFRTLGA